MTLHALSPPATADPLTLLVGELYEQYARFTCAYLYSMVGDWEQANDLNQEVYLRLFRTRIQLPQVVNQRAWIYQIATHLALNHIKRRKRFAWLPWNLADQQVTFVWHETVEEHSIENEVMSRTLARLPVEYRAPLLLFSGHGLRVREIAESLQISESAVKTRLHRARTMFEKAYQEETS